MGRALGGSYVNGDGLYFVDFVNFIDFCSKRNK